MYYIWCLLVFFISFFPAHLGYQPELAWIGFLITILFALTSYIPFLRDMKSKGWFALMAVAVFGYMIESIGVLTCFPYGCFSYSEQLWPKILDIVPWLLVATRPPLVLWVWSRVHTWKQYWWLIRAVWGGLLLVMIDLILDPIAVMMGLRSFTGWGFWFGVPLSNFMGRMFSGTIAVAIMEYFLIHTSIAKKYDTGVWLFLSFFIGYAFWSFVL